MIPKSSDPLRRYYNLESIETFVSVDEGVPQREKPRDSNLGPSFFKKFEY